MCPGKTIRNENETKKFPHRFHATAAAAAAVLESAPHKTLSLVSCRQFPAKRKKYVDGDDRPLPPGNPVAPPQHRRLEHSDGCGGGGGQILTTGFGLAVPTRLVRHCSRCRLMTRCGRAIAEAKQMSNIPFLFCLLLSLADERTLETRYARIRRIPLIPLRHREATQMWSSASYSQRAYHPTQAN